MTNVGEHFRLPMEPLAEPGAVVLGPNVRFTVLTSRLIRLEYSPAGLFEDRPSQVFWHRKQPVPDFTVKRSDHRIEVITEHLHLRYAHPRARGQARAGAFTPETLSITLRETGAVWRYGDPDTGNLRGTYRTLDSADGPVQLEPGLLARAGWTVVDDSRALVFNDAGWLEPRAGNGQDLYFFGYGRDYRGCLRDFGRIAGPTPLLPRWALGNWWSRYWAYSQDELLSLMQEFQARDVLLSVCIVDMDWHITQTGNDSSGWTGYTWNRALFPDPEGFLARLHELGLKTALNLHPAAGVYPHEDAYPAMAAALGVDPASQQPIPFDIADPAFAQVYFEILHHPLEAQGVDFWWVDWQQGTQTRAAGLDPLWWLNHLHFLDRGRDGVKRPFVFSRWGGLGNHRTPIGFSGDTVVTWASLAFQPYFTATAANVGYGWWSHDIGGHMRGVEEPELYARWVQFGVFSPILRLHSTKNPYHERRPWGYDAETFRVTRDAMRLRHALIPYLYTMAWRNARESLPLVAPMYHAHPEAEEAYCCPNQYLFGSELIAAPFTSPRDPHTRRSRQVIWLPKGDWFDFFTGERVEGDAWRAVYGGLDEIPVFARAGAIVPLGPTVGWGGLANPDRLTLYAFPGAAGAFTLYEDDGETTAYQRGHYALTRFAQAWTDDALRFTVAPVEGDRAQVPPMRAYTLVFRGLVQPDRVTAHVEGAAVAPVVDYDAETETLTLRDVTLRPDESLTVTLSAAGGLLSRRDWRPAAVRRLLRAFRLETNVKSAIDAHLPEIIADVRRLADYAAIPRPAQIRALVEVITGAGAVRFDQAGPENDRIVLWNNEERPGLRFRLSAGDAYEEVFHSEQGEAPRFWTIAARDLEPGRWRLAVDSFGLTSVTFHS